MIYFGSVLLLLFENLLHLGIHRDLNNLLLLDEPTNHMDIKSKDILKQALKAFDGTLIVVSHDRDFLDGLVDKLYEFRDGKVTEHLGSVAEFLEKKKIDSLQELERKNTVVKSEPVLQKNASYEILKEKSRIERKKQNRISYLENEIGKLEKCMKDIEVVLASPGPNDDIIELTRSYLEEKRELDALTEEWGSLI